MSEVYSLLKDSDHPDLQDRAAGTPLQVRERGE